MAIFEVHSRNLPDLHKALRQMVRYQTIWYREGSTDFYMRLSGKHLSVAKGLESMFQVNAKEVDKVPPGVPLYSRVEVEEPFLGFSGQVLAPGQVSEFLDEVSIQALVDAVERRLWYMRNDAALAREREKAETEAEMVRINAVYDPQITEKDAGIAALMGAAGKLKALAR